MNTLRSTRSVRREGSAAGFRKHECRLFAGVAAICICSDIVLPPGPGLAAGSLLYLTWAIWLTRREARAALLTLNPVVSYQIWQAAVLGVSPLYISLTNLGGTSVPLGNQHVSLEWVAYGHAIMVAGSYAFYAGMKRFQPNESASECVPLASASALHLAVAVLAGSVFLAARASVTQYAGSTVAQLSFLPMAVLCMVATNQRGARRRSANTRFWILLLGSLWLLLLNARGDSKMELILSFIPLLWWLLRMQKHIRLLMVAAALAALYLLVFAPLVFAVRNNVYARDESGALRVLSPNGTPDVLSGMLDAWSSGPEVYIQTWFDETMLRMCDPVATGLVASLVEEGGFLDGRGFDYLPISAVPRALWPQKPKINRGPYFSAVLGMATDPSLATTSTGQTSAGELYWNFGWSGMLLGMYLLGASVSGLWWRAAGSDPRHGLLEMTAYTGAMLSFVLGTGAAAGPLFTTCVSAGIFWRVLIGLRGKAAKRQNNAVSDRRLQVPIHTC
jgi:hypothetical protein